MFLRWRSRILGRLCLALSCVTMASVPAQAAPGWTTTARAGDPSGYQPGYDLQRMPHLPNALPLDNHLIAAEESTPPSPPPSPEAPSATPSTTSSERPPPQDSSSTTPTPAGRGKGDVQLVTDGQHKEKKSEEEKAKIVYPPPTSPAEQLEIEAAHEGYRINFRNVPMVQYLRWVSQISNTNFIYNQKDIDFAVTIVSEEPASIEDIMSVMLQILRIHGLDMAEQGNNLIIYKDADAAKIAEVVDTLAEQVSPNVPPIITRVYKLANLNPEGLQAVIVPLLSPEAVVEVSSETGHLIVTDITSNINKVSELIQALDTPKIPIEIAVYHTQYGDPGALATLTERIMAPLIKDQPFNLVPQSATNAIYIVSTPYLIQKAIATLRTLDVPAAQQIEQQAAQEKSSTSSTTQEEPEPTPQRGGPQNLPKKSEDGLGTHFEIYKLQYHDGSDMVIALREIAASMVEGGMTDSALVSAIRTIQWIKSNNSLVVTGTPAAIVQVTRLLHELDVPLQQVLIEMLILKTDLTNSLGFGVEWAAVGQAGDSFSGAIASTPAGTSTSAFTLPNVRPGFPAGDLPLLPGLAMDAIGSVIKKDSTHFLSIQALINAIEADEDMEVVTNQKLLVQDSKTATVFVGQQIAFSEGTIAFGEGTDFATTSFDYRDIGTSMRITPYIGNSNIITLEIAQEVSETLEPVLGSTGSSNVVQVPTTDRTNTTTRVHVPDRHFLMISGQIRGETQNNRSGLPCLGGLPIIGGIFASTSQAVIKNNLIIFIRPHVVASVVEMLELNREQVCQFKEWNQAHPLELGLREWLNLPDTCRPVNFPCNYRPCQRPPRLQKGCVR